MALSGATVLEVRLTGSDTNGGGFVTGATGTDWSQQDTAQYSVTDGVTAGTTTITSATANFGTDVVGNIMYVQGGTGSVVAGWYQITARTNSTTITVDRSTGLTSGTGVTLKIGGALASPGLAASIATVAGNITYIKYDASPYVITTASTNVSGGCPLPSSSTTIAGYDGTRSVTAFPANRPTLQLNSGVSSATIFLGTNNSYRLYSVILDGNNQTSSRGLFQSGEVIYVKAINFTATGSATVGVALSQNSVGKAMFCEITGCTTTYGINFSNQMYNYIHDNTFASGGQAYSGGTFAYACIADSNTGTNNDGFAAFNLLTNCVAYNNSRYGFAPFNNDLCIAVNCVSEGNTWGYFNNSSRSTLINCADYGNSSGRKNTVSLPNRWFDEGAISGSSSFFTNAAGADFTINNTAGAGALLKDTGFPTTFPF